MMTVGEMKAEKEKIIETISEEIAKNYLSVLENELTERKFEMFSLGKLVLDADKYERIIEKAYSTAGLPMYRYTALDNKIDARFRNKLNNLLKINGWTLKPKVDPKTRETITCLMPIEEAKTSAKE